MKEKHACVGDVRHIGLFSCLELVKDKETREPLVPYGKDPDGTMEKIIGLLRERGFMTYSHENMVFVNPPLIITGEQVGEELAKLDEVLSIVDKDML
jgi:taurine--2-oxoglutarate transaminase